VPLNSIFIQKAGDPLFSTTLFLKEGSTFDLEEQKAFFIEMGTVKIKTYNEADIQEVAERPLIIVVDSSPLSFLSTKAET